MEHPTQSESNNFVRTFNVNHDIKSASIVVAADNNYSMYINGQLIAEDQSGSNFKDFQKDTYNIAQYLNLGSNEIKFIVVNLPFSGSVSETNPAGLLYKISIVENGEDCGGGGGSNPAPTVSISADPSTITKGATSTISWTSTNAVTCSALWTSSTDASGNQVVSPEADTDYGITCSGAGGSVTATTTITVTNGGGGGNPTPSVSLTANPSSIQEGSSSVLTWDSSNTNYCSAPWTSATSTSGTYTVSPSGTTDYSISCGGDYGTTTASATVTVNKDNGGGGGGGGGIGGHRHPVVVGEILGATSCGYLRDYLHIGWQNDPIEVLKLQSFLNVFEGESLSYTSVFDKPTFDAVSRFQNKYFDDILAPWGHKAPTGFVYILTKKKVNEIYCNTVLSLSQANKDEIATFKAFMDSQDVLSSASFGGNVGVGPSADYLQNSVSNNAIQPSQTSSLSDTVSSQTATVELKDNYGEKGQPNQSVVRNMAISLLSLPEKALNDINYAIALLIIILLALLVLRNMFGSKNKNSSFNGSIVGKKEAPTNNSKGSPVIIMPGKSGKSKEDEIPEEEIIIDEGADEITVPEEK